MEATQELTIQSTIVRQIGRMNILAISGGRVDYFSAEDGIRLPVSNGYSVEVVLDRASDTYTVRRLFIRSGVVRVKGEASNVYCDEVGDMAYNASCFRSYDADEWMTV